LTIQTLSQITLEQWQADFVIEKFNQGMRSNRLGSQPAPWLLRGLQILESGGSLTSERIEAINRAGGTDHPDPWVG